jgi:hypothetical protein
MLPVSEHTDPPVLLEPEALRIARNLYRHYQEVDKRLGKPLLGVAVNSETHHTTLIFSAKPVLLPWEFFVPHQLLNPGSTGVGAPGSVQ